MKNELRLAGYGLYAVIVLPVLVLCGWNVAAGLMNEPSTTSVLMGVGLAGLGLLYTYFSLRILWRVFAPWLQDKQETR